MISEPGTKVLDVLILAKVFLIKCLNSFSINRPLVEAIECNGTVTNTLAKWVAPTTVVCWTCRHVCTYRHLSDIVKYKYNNGVVSFCV